MFVGSIIKYKKNVVYIYNGGMKVNFYKLHFLFPYFFSPTKQMSFLSLYFPSSQPNTHEEKLKSILSPSTFYPSQFIFSHFFTTPTKHTLSESLA